jgi:hypothetical protein
MVPIAIGCQGSGSPGGGEPCIAAILARPLVPRKLGAFEALPVGAYARAAKRLLVLTQAQARRIQASDIAVEPAYEWILRGAAPREKRAGRRARR